MVDRSLHRRIVTGLFLVCALGASGVAKGETGRFNLHTEVGPAFALSGWQANQLGPGISAGGAFEVALAQWVGLEFSGRYSQFFDGRHPSDYRGIGTTDLFTLGFGGRFRIGNDEVGYLFPWSPSEDHVGNLWGNWWLDYHVDYMNTGGLSRFGLDMATGFQLSLINGFQVGPFARLMWVYQPDSKNRRDARDLWVMSFGLNISMAIPPKGKVLADVDNDTIFDVNDECPNQAEDFDSYEDGDGCPDEDNDGDGVPDIMDLCAESTEDEDGFQDADGCPDFDNDQDGFGDADDKCPLQPEDMDGFQDGDGCPDLDNDGDGILDANDKCPLAPETTNGVDDDDGCPEPDLDNDGFFNDKDKCPTEPETVNGVDDDDGCPDEALVEVQKDKILLGERVFFRLNRDKVRGRSRNLVQQLASLLKSHPEYALVSIEGHADRQGSRKYNLRLSEKRAQAVKDMLVGYGVKASRLVAQGFGENRPWMEGYGREAAEMNRRVEIVIRELDPALATTPLSPEIRAAFQVAGPPLQPAAKTPKGENPYD